MITNINLPLEKIQKFCHKWQVIELALFGSVLREDFRPDSDIDVLLTFSPTAKRGLTETLPIRDELETIFNRNVDLIALQQSVGTFRFTRKISPSPVGYCLYTTPEILTQSEFRM
ncbi:MAG: nucleotidyltransferase domain-containing protein, partial [Jaaginema sp. PMC 1080.18]|nr:nucleotidyltransferase domain-containing protein [Jaaginema sp. PMC 1080.18]